MDIKILSEEHESEYDEFLLSIPETLLYHSNKYRLFLKEYLKSKDVYHIAVNANGEIEAAIPSFIYQGEKGKVLNSLPFYGSNGGVISRKGTDRDVLKELLGGFYEYSNNEKCISSTIITSPFERQLDIYEEFRYNYKDERIGQVTPLSAEDKDADTLIAKLNLRARNIKKARRNSVTVTERYDKDAMEFIIHTHKENMELIGGLSKPPEFFNLIPRFFEPEKDYKIFVADVEGVPAAGLLLFSFNKTVEYFTPVVKEEFKSIQALSLIIFEAMRDAAANGYTSWNWGGTWLTQTGVYQFKKKWATVDMPYYYYTSLNDKSILSMTRNEILAAYPNYYVLPFDKLER